MLTNVSFSQEEQTNVPEDFFSTTNNFIEAVNAHDYDAVFNTLEKKYRKEQLRFLKGNKEQLIDELLSGFNEAGEFKNCILSEVMNIMMINFEPTEGGDVQVYFEVELQDNILTVELIVSPGKKGKHWGVVGAMG